MASLLTAPLVADQSTEAPNSVFSNICWHLNMGCICSATVMCKVNVLFLFFYNKPVRCRPRGLFRSPSMPTGGRAPLKRPDRPRDENTPVRVKRRRSVAGSHVTAMEQDEAGPQQVQLWFWSDFYAHIQGRNSSINVWFSLTGAALKIFQSLRDWETVGHWPQWCYRRFYQGKVYLTNLIITASGIVFKQ